jgi:hypothetical protein
MQDLDVSRLLEPGPIRTAAVAAGAGTIKMTVAICGDRGRALAAAVIDSAVSAAQAEATA